MNAHTDDRLQLCLSKEHLTVTYLPSTAPSGESEPAAWRVAVALHPLEVGTDFDYLAISIEFARYQDAARALAALEVNGLTTSERLRAAGKALVRRIMIESLAW